MGTFEHRKLIRANIILKVLYKTLGEPKLSGFAFSKNLSATGISIIMPDKFSKDTELELEVYLPGKKQPIAAKAKVVWQAECALFPNAKKKYYSTGMQFLDMSTQDATEASDFIKNVLNKQSTTQTKRIIDRIDKKDQK
jgi:hypothetical protein